MTYQGGARSTSDVRRKPWAAAYPVDALLQRLSPGVWRFGCGLPTRSACRRLRIRMGNESPSHPLNAHAARAAEAIGPETLCRPRWSPRRRTRPRSFQRRSCTKCRKAGGDVAAAACRGRPVNTGCGAIDEAKWFAAEWAKTARLVTPAGQRISPAAPTPRDRRSPSTACNSRSWIACCGIRWDRCR